MFLGRQDVERAVRSYSAYLARADEAPEGRSTLTLRGPFAIGSSTFAHYQGLRNGGLHLWFVALEDQTNGDGVLINGSDGGVPLFSQIPVSAVTLAKFGVAEQDANKLNRRPLVPREPVDLDLVREWLAKPVPGAIDYRAHLAVWQFLERLPDAAGAADLISNLDCAVYQHLWIGIYAPPVGVDVPGSGRELQRLAEVLSDGLRRFHRASYRPR